MSKRLKVLLVILFFSLVIGNIGFAYNYFVGRKALSEMSAKRQSNINILSFIKLFMEKVLQGSTAVSFDDRLKLENSVRALNDQGIFEAWESFTNAKSQEEVQKYYYILFDLLLKRIAI